MNKKVKNSKTLSKVDGKIQKRLLAVSIVTILLFSSLIIKIGWIQFIDGSSLKERAYKQQVANRTINPNRGTLYDATGKALAISSEVDTVKVIPSNLATIKKEKIDMALFTKTLEQIFDIDYNEVLNKLNTAGNDSVLIAEKVPTDKIVTFEDWLKKNNISRSGIEITSEVRRFYPYDNLASNLIGFTGTDNQGLVGLEYSLDNLLSGTSGKTVSITSSTNGEIPNGEQTYIPAKDGQDVFLTIDMNIQSISENHLRQAVENNKANSRKYNYYGAINW